MNKEQQSNWCDNVLREVLRGIVQDETLRESLVFKGARILNLHLQTRRQSLDIDANITLAFQQEMPNRDEQAKWFKVNIERALRSYFEGQERVRYTLTNVRVTKKPARNQHPHGWDGLVVELAVTDAHLMNVRNLPRVEVEIAAPESLGAEAVVMLDLDGNKIQAYDLHRIAGEKLRAFLTSLPKYRAKINSQTRVVRAKDLHDIARILEFKPISEKEFWKSVGDEFRLACESRFVDCEGPDTFKEQWDSTKRTYEGDATLSAVPWLAAERALDQVLSFLDHESIWPFTFEIPSVDENQL